MSSQEEAEAIVREFAARKLSGTPVKDWARRLLRAAALSGSLRIEADESNLIFTVGGRALAFDTGSIPAPVILRTIAGPFAFELGAMIFDAQRITAPEPPADFCLGSPEVAAFVQGVTSQVRPLAFDAYGFEANLDLAEDGSRHRLHIETQNTNGRPYVVAITRI